jgi:hypothetical protein
MTEKSFADALFNALSPVISYRAGSKQPTKLFIHRNQVHADGLFSLAKKYGISAKLKEISKDAYLDLQDNDAFAIKVMTELNALFQKKHEDETQNGDSEESFDEAQSKLFNTYFNSSIQTPLSNLKIVQIPEKAKTLYLHDEVKDISYGYNYDVVMDTIRRLIPHDGVYSTYLAQQLVHCREIYSPHAPRFTKDETDHECYNTYNLPPWRVGWQPDPCVTELHKPTKEFLDHLTNNSKQDLDMILSWVRDAVFYRAKWILVLCGMPGGGKNTLVEQLTANLVGCAASSNNYFKGSRSFLESTFQGAIKRHQLILFDEIHLTESRSETLKDWHNNSGNAEDKYATSKGPVPLSCSIVIATNLLDNLHLKLSDRKYLVPTLTETDLKHAKGQEFIDGLLEEWKDPEVLRSVASYLYNTYPEHMDFDKNTPRFLEVCWVSYPEYLKKFICLAVVQKTVKESEFRKLAKNTRSDRVSVDRLRGFVAEFAAGNRIKNIGTWKHDKDFKWVFTSEIVGRKELVHNAAEFELFDKGSLNGADKSTSEVTIVV